MILIMVVCYHPRFLVPDGPLLVSAKGLEPLTNGLKGHCSTIELRAHRTSDSVL